VLGKINKALRSSHSVFGRRRQVITPEDPWYSKEKMPAAPGCYWGWWGRYKKKQPLYLLALGRRTE